MGNLYKKIQDLCNKNDISISEMCRNAGVPRGSLGDLKSGKIKSLSSLNLQKVADYFMVSAEFLLNDSDVENSKAILLEDARRDVRILFDLAKDAKPEDVKKAITFFEFLKNGNDN